MKNSYIKIIMNDRNEFTAEADIINDEYLLELDRLFGTITSMKLAKTSDNISKELKDIT